MDNQQINSPQNIWLELLNAYVKGNEKIKLKEFLDFGKKEIINERDAEKLNDLIKEINQILPDNYKNRLNALLFYEEYTIREDDDLPF